MFISICQKRKPLVHNDEHLYKLCLYYPQIEAGKRAEAVATVVAAVDQARVRSPWETEKVDETYVKKKTLEYGYKEHAVKDHEAQAEHHVATKEVKTVYVPPEKHIPAAEKKEVHVSTEVRLSFHSIIFQKLCLNEIFFSLENSITFSITFSLLYVD